MTNGNKGWNETRRKIKERERRPDRGVVTGCEKKKRIKIPCERDHWD